MSAFKDKFRRQEVVTVINCDFASADLAEAVARLGFDAVLIDCEHGSAGIKEVDDLARAVKAADGYCMVRSESSDPRVVARYAGRGIDGVMVPRLESAIQLEEVVAAVQYARVKDWDENFVLVAMIESAGAIAVLDEILAVEGVDAYFIGPSDLSMSMGYRGDMKHPEVQAAVRSCLARIREAGGVGGTWCDLNNVQDCLAEGARYLYSHAKYFMSHGAKAMQQAILDAGELVERDAV